MRAKTITVGVLALQGGFVEHINLVHKAADHLHSCGLYPGAKIDTIQVRTAEELARCDALIIPGGESTTISFVAAQSGLLEPLRDFVKVQKKPVWGTCAGLILLSDQANATKKGGQELIGGLGVRVHRNHFGRQIESFEAPLDLPFLTAKESSSPGIPFPGVFIRAPVVEELLVPTASETSADAQAPTAAVTVLAKLPGRVDKAKPGDAVSQAHVKDDSGDIIAVKQGNVMGTSFHPELTSDARIHMWWLSEVIKAL